MSRLVLTTDDGITVIGEKTSGEIEYVLLCGYKVRVLPQYI